MEGKKKKYLFITGGVCSSLGKGIAASSLGAILKADGYKVNMMKIDPYLNVDAGTMRPYEHGEVYVTGDGTETDLDLGNYERFVRVETSRLSSVTTGQVYQYVIDAERRGEYLGQTVQVIPHITDEIKRRIRVLDENQDSDIVIVEIGGTVGDIEGIPFIEAIRQFSIEEGKDNVKFAHLTLIPSIRGSNELKTKPTQHSVKTLMSMGIQPDFLLCRAQDMLPPHHRQKIALFCNIEEPCIFSGVDVKKSIYEVILSFQEQGADKIVLDKFRLEHKKGDLSQWRKLVEIESNPKNEVRIGFIGKYVRSTDTSDTYKSVDEALKHGGFANDSKVHIVRIDAETFEQDPEQFLREIDGILVPGGFGSRGIEGKILAAKLARERKIPYFGICLGMQCMVIEYARNICGMQGANSTEFAQETTYPVIELLANLKGITYLGGTMRLGKMKSLLNKGTLAAQIYKSEEITERHRHRYEVNPEFVELLEQKGLVISARAENGLVEMVEAAGHPWYLGGQFHPEFKSSPLEPAPLFASFIKAALKFKKEHGGK
ncbi:MAG: CTP synthase [Spirochaetes bacterium GWF1_51_8]|nr:MAG: CTP synthase [Spirochaetes bacterium GWF1_51_8]